MSEYIPKSLRQAVEQRANRRCEYCRSSLSFTTESFAAEHIIPVSRGGATELDNLALSCSALATGNENHLAVQNSLI